MPKSAGAAAEVTTNLVLNIDTRAQKMLPEWSLELARQKMLFLTTPAEIGSTFKAVAQSLDSGFSSSNGVARERAISFMLGIAESLSSPVELSHSLQNAKFLGRRNALSAADLANLQRSAAELVEKWARKDSNAFLAVTSHINSQDLSAGEHDGLFSAWAKRWEKRNGRDPYASASDYLACFTPLYQRGKYYPDLHFARESGKTRTQFLTDCPRQAVRARRMGCLGVYDNADLTEAQVLEATLAFRSIYLLRGLSLVLGLPDMCECLSDQVKLFDEILLEGVSESYSDVAIDRVGAPNSPSDVSLVTFLLGQISDTIREYRVEVLVDDLKIESKLKAIDPKTVRSLRDEPTNNIEFILQQKEWEIEFVPGDEEDAIDHAGALLAKRAAVLLREFKPTIPTKQLVACKHNYLPNLELLDVDFAADSPSVQRDCVMRPVEVDDWKSLWEDMGRDGNPLPGTIWAKRAQILSSIWPEWDSVYAAGGIMPEA